MKTTQQISEDCGLSQMEDGALVRHLSEDFNNAHDWLLTPLIRKLYGRIEAVEVFKAAMVEPASHTPNGYDPRWLSPINEALTDRDGDIVITDISDEVWELFIGPMLDAIERDEVEVSK